MHSTMIAPRRRPHGKRSSENRRKRGGQTGPSPVKTAMSPISAPLPAINTNLLQIVDADDDKFLMKSNSGRHHSSFRRTSTNASVTSAGASSSSHDSCWEYTGLNIVIPALSVWLCILIFFWWPELKDNALDYYYLQYPEQQPLSPIPGTVLPLIPSVWIYDPDKKENTDEGSSERKQEVKKHLKEHQQPHYYMMPQDFFDQQPPSDLLGNSTHLLDDNTALQAPAIRGVLIFLHNCHQSGLHAFQLPESRIVAAHALQRGIAIFSPTASSASTLLTSSSAKGGQQKGKGGAAAEKDRSKTMGNNSPEKNCWSASLDGGELLGPLLYEWAREFNVTSLPRMAIGISNGANLLISSSLYKTLRLQSMALYASHHPDGFDPSDLEKDIVPATAFIAFPKSARAFEYTLQHYNALRRHFQQLEEVNELKKEEEETEEEEEEEEETDENGDPIAKVEKPVTFPRTQLWKVAAHEWTPALCQERLPEYHTRCRSFFRHVQKYQKSRQQKEEERHQKLDPKQQERLKRQRLAGLKNMKKSYALISSTGEVLQSSKNVQWIPFMESQGLDDWTTHMMAFSLSATVGHTSSGVVNNNRRSRVQRQKLQLMRFPTTATPEGRSWLWASMLQEIEVAYGVQEMTSEYSSQVLDFLMYHAGLNLGEQRQNKKQEPL
jgi:hypothetical protein